MAVVRVEVETELERLTIVVELEAASGAATSSTMGGPVVTRLAAAAMSAVDEVRRSS